MSYSYAAGDAAQYSMQLLRGQMVNSLVSGQYSGGISLNEFMLGKKPESAPKALPAGMGDDALTRLVRSDAQTLKSGSARMAEGAEVVKNAAGDFAEVDKRLCNMIELTEKVRQNPSFKCRLQDEYNCQAVQIGVIIAASNYKGQNLLDGSTWDGGRVSCADSACSTGKYRLGSGAGSALSDLRSGATQNGGPQNGGPVGELTLFSLSSFKEAFAETDLDHPEQAASKLASARAMVSTIKDSYEARAGLYASESSSLERQASVLEQAAHKAAESGQQGEQGIRDAVLDILLSDQGNVLEARS